MEFGKMKLSGLSIVAALLLSTAAFAQDAGSDEGATELNTHPIIIDGDQSATYDVPVSDDPAVDPAGDPTGGDNGIAVGEPDPSGDGSADDDGGDDPAIDPGTDEGADPGTDDGTGIEGEGEITIYYMDGGPCIDCNVLLPGRPPHPSEVERTQHTSVLPKVSTRHSSAAAFAVPSAMAQCLAVHPRSAWICEWQNGAGQ